MRLSLTLSLLAISFLAGCANEGVIVEKNSAPQPFYHSLGIDGSYAFMLRDQAGTVRRQLVTPEVFERYAIGDYFNDLQPGLTTQRPSEGKNLAVTLAMRDPAPVVRSTTTSPVVRTATITPAADRTTAAKPALRTAKTGSTVRSKASRRTASKSKAGQKTVSRKRKTPVAKNRPVRSKKAVEPIVNVKTRDDASMFFIQVSRCR